MIPLRNFEPIKLNDKLYCLFIAEFEVKNYWINTQCN